MSVPVGQTEKKEQYLNLFARCGLAAKGVVHCLFAGIAVTASLGLTSREGSRREAFAMVYEQPFGQVMLFVLGFSLLGFVMFRGFQSIKDTDHKGKGFKGLRYRAGKAGGAIIYLSASYYAFRLALVGRTGGNEKEFFVSRLLEHTWGQLAVGGFALWLIWQGFNQCRMAFTGSFMKNLKLRDHKFEKMFKKLGAVGHTSRGVVYCILGYLLCRGALYRNVRDAEEDTGGAFSFMQNEFGNLLLAAVALGLFLYGTFLFVRAKYQRLQLSESVARH
jgi:hypothetical protein